MYKRQIESDRASLALVKLDKNFDYQWSQLIQRQNEEIFGNKADNIVLSPNGYIYVGGAITRGTVFPNDSTFKESTIGIRWHDTFFAKFDTTGEFYWFDSFDEVNHHRVEGMAINPDGERLLYNLSIRGEKPNPRFIRNMDFGPAKYLGVDWGLNVYHVVYAMYNTGQMEIEVNGNMLSASHQDAVSYTWYKDGEVIPGATEPTYTYTEDAEYRVCLLYTSDAADD